MNNEKIKELEYEIEGLENRLKCGVIHPRDYDAVMARIDFLEAEIKKIEEGELDAGIKAFCKKATPYEPLNESLLPFSESNDDSESEADFRRKRADEYQL